MNEFKAEVGKLHGVSQFSDHSDLAWKVTADLSRELHAANKYSIPTPDTIPNLILKDEIGLRFGELIEILEHRAAVIRDQLAAHHKHVNVSNYLLEFTGLHEKHIDALRRGNVILAHEVLGEIHQLSRRMASDDFWTGSPPGVRYSLRGDAFERGALICGYVGGELRSYSEKYPSNEYGNPFSDYVSSSPLGSVDVYRIVLST